MALYRKYRPATFAEVVGQRHVTDPLSAALASRGADGAPDRINHAYLFSGPRGCGKTSSARILARSLNCVEGPTATPCGTCDSCVALGPGGTGNLDVMELDAASHNGVDDMRDLREKAMYAPAESRYRVLIIDEAHMITKQGFNALLKIVEEPPEHLIFVFATTEPDDMLTTIRSRTHHYPFRLLPPNLMKGLLQQIVAEEHVPVADDVYPLVIRAGGGSPRDSLSVLDQLLSGAGPEGVTHGLAAGLLGVSDQGLLDDAMAALASADRAALFGCVDRVVRSGQDPKRFAEDLLGRVRDLLVIAAVPNAMEEGLVDAPEDRVGAMREQAGAVPTGTLTRFADVLQRGLPDMSGATSPRLLLEVLCARMLLPASEQSVESLVQRIEALERGGVQPGQPGQAPQQAQQVQQTQQVQNQAPTAAPAQQAAPAGGAAAAGGAAFVDDPNMSPLQRARMARQSQQPVQQAPQPQQVQPQTVQPAAQEQQPQPVQSAAQEQPRQSQQPEPLQQSEPQRPPAQQEADSAEVPDQEEQARKAREMREISRRMQEQAREHERAERERLAKEREAATRAAEGESGAVAPQAEPQQETQRDVQPAPQPDSQQEAQPHPEPQPEAQQMPESQPVEQPSAVEAPHAQPEHPEGQGVAGVGEASSSEHLTSLREAWPQVVEYAGEDNIPVRVMAAQAVPIALEDGVLTIGHHTGALANRLNDPANSAALGAAVQRVEGIEVEVRCVVGTSARATSPQSTAPRSTAPRGGGERSGARARQHQAPAAEGSEGAKPAGHSGSAADSASTGKSAASADDGNQSTIVDSSEGHSPAGMTGGHSVPDADSPVSEMPPAEAEQRVEAREQAQEQAREEAREEAREGVASPAPQVDSGRPVPAYRRILEERRRAQEAAQGAQSSGADVEEAPADGARKKYVPPPPAPGSQGVVKRRHDDIPLPPEPYDDAPPPPEPDFGGYPDDGGYGTSPSFGGGQPAPSNFGGPQPNAAPSQNSMQQNTPQQNTPQQNTPHEGAAPAPGPATGGVGSHDGGSQGGSVNDDGLDDDERELLDAARTPGQLDHRDQKEVVMELLAQELGAKPL